MSIDEKNETAPIIPEKIKNAVSISITVITALLVAFVVYIMVCSSRGEAVKVFGKSVLTVVTGSMEPSLHVGDYIIVSDTPTEELKEGDIISFYSEENDVSGKIVTHRIIGKDSSGNFITKGDANEISDSKAVRSDQIIGRYVRKSRFLKWLNSFGDRRKLLMIAVIIPMVLIAIYEVRTISRIKTEIDEKKSLTDEEKEKLIREAIDREKERLAREGLPSEPDEPAENEEAAGDEEEETAGEDDPPEQEEAPVEEETKAESEVETVDSGRDNEEEDA